MLYYGTMGYFKEELTTYWLFFALRTNCAVKLRTELVTIEVL